jgi:hypothetical protein
MLKKHREYLKIAEPILKEAHIPVITCNGGRHVALMINGHRVPMSGSSPDKFAADLRRIIQRGRNEGK